MFTDSKLLVSLEGDLNAAKSVDLSLPLILGNNI